MEDKEEIKETKGAYDRRGLWREESLINSLGPDKIMMYFGKEKELIKIVSKKVDKNHD